jgi:uncharacterized protein DUF3489
MTTFIIDPENSITALTNQEVAAGIPDGNQLFTSDRELVRLAADWPAGRLVSIWNGIPGVKLVSRFTSRKAAAARIWKAIQSLAGKDEASQPEPAKAAKPAKTAKNEKSSKRQKTAAPKKAGGKDAERSNKKAEVIALMKRAKGVTLAEIVEATGWQKHTVRGFVSILGSKGGQKIESTKNPSGERTYRIAKSRHQLTLDPERRRGTTCRGGVPASAGNPKKYPTFGRKRATLPFSAASGPPIPENAPAAPRTRNTRQIATRPPFPGRPSDVTDRWYH